MASASGTLNQERLADREQHLRVESVQQREAAAREPVKEWALPLGATLGSSVRARGIMLEIRARLPLAAKKLLGVKSGVLTLKTATLSDVDRETVSAVVASTLKGVGGRPVLPREVEDILAITSAERHRWRNDGRLQSAGTRTVKLRGRARTITFHVFDPRHIEDILDRDRVTVWREDDASKLVERRRWAAGKAAITRSKSSVPKATPGSSNDRNESERHHLQGFVGFEVEGLLH